MDDNKQKALAAALGQIEKQFGKGSVMRLGDSGVDMTMGACRGVDLISLRARRI